MTATSRPEIAPAVERRWTASADRLSDPWTALSAVGATVFVVALASSQGGYFPTSWGWGAVLLLTPTVVAWALGWVRRLSAWHTVAVALVTALGVWTALSIVWSTVPDQSVLETERSILYVAAALAAASFVRRRSVTSFVGAIFVAIVAVSSYSLATRLFPARLGVTDPIGVYRLSDPIGYWNALALFAAIGLLLALTFTARAQATWARCVSAATVPLLTSTLYFTFGRAAWLSLGIAVAVALLLDPRRIQLVATVLTIAPTAALTLLVCTRGHALTHRGAALDVVARDGHAAAVRIIGLAALAALVELSRSSIERRVAFPNAVRAAFGLTCTVAVLAGAIGVVVHAGGPIELAKRAKSTFVTASVSHSNDLNRRLFSFSGNGRTDLWHAAWRDARVHPWLGSGAGTYERYWLRNRPNAAKVRDAHSLYLESLAELGPVGLGLVVGVLAVGLAACVRARRTQIGPGLAAVVVVYATHAAVDWDWEVSVLGVIVIGVIMAAIAAADAPQTVTASAAVPHRTAVAGVASILAVLALAGLAGNRASAASDSAVASGDLAKAASDAVRAQRWMPWSPQPWSQLGNVELAAGDVGAARRSFAHELRIDPGSWSAWLDAARAAPSSSRRFDLRMATRLNPFSPEIAQYKASLGQGS